MNISTLAVTLLTVSFTAPVFADGKAHEHMTHAKPMQVAQSAAEMADGEIKRISKGSKKLTIKHGEIKSLDMPPMTMSFGVSDEKMLEMVKKGDKVKFKAVTVDGKMIVTEIMPQ